MSKKSYIKTAFTDTLEIFIDELKNIYRDSGIRIIFFAASLIYPILYGFVYKNEVLRDIPIAVVNHCNTPLSRDFIRKLDATPDVDVAFEVNSMEEAKVLFSKTKAKGIVTIPSDFSKCINEGKQAHVFAYSNIATMLYFRGIYSSLNYTCLDYGNKIQVHNLEMQGLTNKQATVAATPIISEGNPLYNPGSGFASFLLPAALILIIQQTLVIGIGMLAGTAREENKYHNLIPYKKKYHGTLRIISGKGLAYFAIYLIIGIYNLILIPRLFQLPHFLSVGSVLPFIIPLLLSCIFFGMAISVFFWNRESSLMIYLSTSIPLLILAGFTWPGTNITPFWKMISYFFPSTFGIQGFLKMNSMGASIFQIGPECLGLWIQTGIYFIFTFFVYRWQIRLSEKKIK
jgi:ABC-2 type transport system permease protein